MKEKYIKEIFPRYFEFGYSDRGGVDLSNGEDDSYITCSKCKSRKIIEDRDKAVDMIISLSQKLYELDKAAFMDIWNKKE